MSAIAYRIDPARNEHLAKLINDLRSKVAAYTVDAKWWVCSSCEGFFAMVIGHRPRHCPYCGIGFDQVAGTESM
jgi:rubrerythrin